MPKSAVHTFTVYLMDFYWRELEERKGPALKLETGPGLSALLTLTSVV